MWVFLSMCQILKFISIVLREYLASTSIRIKHLGSCRNGYLLKKNWPCQHSSTLYLWKPPRSNVSWISPLEMHSKLKKTFFNLHLLQATFQFPLIFKTNNLSTKSQLVWETLCSTLNYRFQKVIIEMKQKI